MDNFSLFDRHMERIIQNNSLIASKTQTNNFLNHLLNKGGGFKNINNGLPSGGGFKQDQNEGIPDGGYSKRHTTMQEMMQGTQEEQKFEQDERDHDNAHNVITNDSIDEQVGKVNSIEKKLNDTVEPHEKRIQGIVTSIMIDKKLTDGKNEKEVDEIKQELANKEMVKTPGLIDHIKELDMKLHDAENQLNSMQEKQIQQLDKRHTMTVPLSETSGELYKLDKRLADLQINIHENNENSNRAIDQPIKFVSNTSRRAIIFIPNDKSQSTITFKSLTELRLATGKSNNKIFGKNVIFNHHGEAIQSKLSNMKGVFVGQTPKQVAKLKDNALYTPYNKDDFEYKQELTETKNKDNKKNKATKTTKSN